MSLSNIIGKENQNKKDMENLEKDIDKYIKFEEIKPFVPELKVEHKETTIGKIIKIKTNLIENKIEGFRLILFEPKELKDPLLYEQEIKKDTIEINTNTEPKIINALKEKPKGFNLVAYISGPNGFTKEGHNLFLNEKNEILKTEFTIELEQPKLNFKFESDAKETLNNWDELNGKENKFKLLIEKLPKNTSLKLKYKLKFETKSKREISLNDLLNEGWGFEIKDTNNKNINFDNEEIIDAKLFEKESLLVNFKIYPPEKENLTIYFIDIKIMAMLIDNNTPISKTLINFHHNFKLKAHEDLKKAHESEEDAIKELEKFKLECETFDVKIRELINYITNLHNVANKKDKRFKENNEILELSEKIKNILKDINKESFNSSKHLDKTKEKIEEVNKKLKNKNLIENLEVKIKTLETIYHEDQNTNDEAKKLLEEIKHLIEETLKISKKDNRSLENKKSKIIQLTGKDIQPLITLNNKILGLIKNITQLLTYLKQLENETKSEINITKNITTEENKNKETTQLKIENDKKYDIKDPEIKNTNIKQPTEKNINVNVGQNNYDNPQINNNKENSALYNKLLDLEFRLKKIENPRDRQEKLFRHISIIQKLIKLKPYYHQKYDGELAQNFMNKYKENIPKIGWFTRYKDKLIIIFGVSQYGNTEISFYMEE